MKSIVILFNTNSSYSQKKVFGSKSAFDLSLEWAEKNGDAVKILEERDNPTLTDLLSSMAASAADAGAGLVIFSYADLPFLNTELTGELVKSHTEYKAEYTFADGYPYGLAPEIIDKGTLSILLELSRSVQSALGKKRPGRTSIYELIKTDINSYEVETVLSDTDWRLLRLSFSCSKKADFMACCSLYEKVLQKNSGKEPPAEELSKIASETPGILKTVPGFYEIQLSAEEGSEIYNPYPAEVEKIKKTRPDFSGGAMNTERFLSLLKEIAELSENAVVSLSAWGEGFDHPDLIRLVAAVLNYPGLSVFLETDGQAVSEELCSELSAVVSNSAERTNGYDKVMVAVKMDAFTAPVYALVHNCSAEKAPVMLENAFSAVKRLQQVIPGCVYPQFVRMNQNEAELEPFFRFWSDKESASGGKLIIQKYNDFCGLLPQSKPADLSPVEREVCWHLRRDMTILSNGDSPVCRSCVLSEIAGNVFEEGLEAVWHKTDGFIREQLEKSYCGRCGKCDEFYTFNF